MEASTSFCFLLLFFACSLFFHGTIATEVQCNNLHAPQCMYAVSSDGKRCILEKDTCKSSDTSAAKFAGHIETDECMNACGLGRQNVEEMSQDFIDRICMPACFKSCPNVVDLFSNLAAGQGISLSQRCAESAPPPSASRSSGDSTRRSFLDFGSAPTPSP